MLSVTYNTIEKLNMTIPNEIYKTQRIINKMRKSISQNNEYDKEKYIEFKNNVSYIHYLFQFVNNSKSTIITKK